MPRRAGLHTRIGSLSGLALALLAAAALAGCGSGSGSSSSSASADSHRGNDVAGRQLAAAGELSPPSAAPPLALHNYLGQPVDIDSYRGKAVFVTFIYTHCPDVCPLITSNLRVALNLMGKDASKAQVIAVSVDPRGDTRRAVTKFLAAHEMTGRMQYVIGSARELAAVWKAWGVGSEREVGHPDLVEHTGIVYGITGSGKRLAVYAANFAPKDVAHDAPILAAQ
ncbi:MAG TPA: SCO family protein [Solirubrobacteraceae bacterium]|nr:SCO family protein [Solirubrobacteraceae bacterium]